MRRTKKRKRKTGRVEKGTVRKPSGKAKSKGKGKEAVRRVAGKKVSHPVGNARKGRTRHNLPKARVRHRHPLPARSPPVPVPPPASLLTQHFIILKSYPSTYRYTLTRPLSAGWWQLWRLKK